MEFSISGFKIEKRDLHLLPKGSFYIVQNGRKLEDWRQVFDNENDENFRVIPRVLGGKGGRRVKSVKEEEKLRDWVSKKAQREEERKMRKEAKLEKLRQGHGKHQFNDVDYMNAVDNILEKTDDAVSAGLQASLAQSSNSSSSASANSAQAAPTKPDVADGRDSHAGAEAKKSFQEKDFQDDKVPVPLKKSRPNPPEEPIGNVPNSGSESSDNTAAECVTSQNGEEIADKPISKPFNIDDYSPIDLDSCQNCEELQNLGLDHLKADLMRRGLKCGGNVQERAARLFSVRGLAADEYPKKIRAKK